MKLVRDYQKAEDWDALLSSSVKDVSDDRVRLGYHRLMLDLNLLKDSAAYEETALEALDAGVPAEAQRVIERGEANGVFNHGEALAGRHQRLLDAAKQKEDQSRAELSTLTKQAANSNNGQQDVTLGRTYLSFGQYDPAITALKRGIQKGPSDVGEAQLDLGIAYVESGKKELASEAFKNVPKESKWNNLAQLWELRTASGSPT